MTRRRIVGLIVLIGSLALLLVSYYIKGKVEGGRAQISSAEKKVNQANSLFSLTPATKEIGKGITKGAQKKIDAGKDEVAYYAQLADQLQTAGLIAMALGVVIMIIPSKKQGQR